MSNVVSYYIFNVRPCYHLAAGTVLSAGDKMSDPKTNPYESPQAISDGAAASGFRITFAFVAALLLTGALPIGILLSRSHVLRVFEDFGVELPAITQICTSWGFLLFACGMLLFTLVKEFALAAAVSRQLNRLASWLALGIGAAYGLSLIFPLVKLFQNLA